MTTIVHPSVEERKAQGKAARQQAAPADHTGWTPVPNRPDPVALLEAQDATARTRSRAGPARANGGVAVHVLSWCGEDHGRGLEGHADLGTQRSAVW